MIKNKCHDIRRKIEDELGAQPYEHIHAICGADFFDDLITHSEVAKAYERLVSWMVAALSLLALGVVYDGARLGQPTSSALAHN